MSLEPKKGDLVECLETHQSWRVFDVLGKQAFCWSVFNKTAVFDFEHIRVLITDYKQTRETPDVECVMNTGKNCRRHLQQLAAVIAGGMTAPYQTGKLLNEDEIAEDALAIAAKIIEKSQ